MTTVFRRFKLLFLLMAIFAAGSWSLVSRVSAQTTTTGLDLVFIMDGSGSQTSTDFDLQRAYVKSLARSCLAGSDTRMAVVQFSTTTADVIGLTANLGAVESAVENVSQMGQSTYAAPALQRAGSLLQARGRPSEQAVVLLTDGVLSDQSQSVAEASTLRSANVNLYGVAVGSANLNDLQTVIGPNPVLTSVDFQTLSATLAALVGSACGGVLLEEEELLEPQISVAVRPNPNMSVTRNSTISYEIEITNYGLSSTDIVRLKWPFDANEVTLINAVFDRQSTWIHSINIDPTGDDYIEIWTGRLESGDRDNRVYDVIKGTLTFNVLGNGGDGALNDRVSHKWYDGARAGRTGHSNMPHVVVADANEHRDSYMLHVAPASGPAGSEHVFLSAIFVPKEPVTIWYHRPDGTVVAMPGARASDEGTIELPFATDGLGAGTYTMVAYGEWSRFTASTGFTVE